MDEILLNFVGKITVLTVSSTGIAYGLFVFLGKQWIENKFATKLEEYKSAQNKEIENFKYEINSLFNRVSMIHKKEYEILPTAWIKLHDSKAKISLIVSPLQSYPDLSRLNDDEIRQMLKKNFHWEDKDVTDLLKAGDKNSFFQEKIFWQRLGEAKEVFADYHNYIIRNRIFLSKELQEQFNEADTLMHEALVSKEIGHELKNFKMMNESYRKLKENIEQITNNIEILVQKRLRYSDAL